MAPDSQDDPIIAALRGGRLAHEGSEAVGTSRISLTQALLVLE
jgi:hypothetical protein